MPPWARATVRLTTLLVCVGLATSRLGLVLHELVGHGGATIAVGGDVTDVQLFYLAGGWIRYRLPGPGEGELAIALGGIVVEAVIGIALWLLLARRDTLLTRIVRAVGAALVIHAGWYLATGTWHGYGDGVALYRELGDARGLVAVPAALVTCAMAFAGARLVLGALAATIPGGRRVRIGATLAAMVVAGGLQLGAALGEVALRRDTVYGETMRAERERAISRELAAWQAQQVRAGRDPSAEARAAMERELGRRHATFPFAAVLAVLVAAAILAGAARARPAAAHVLGNRLLACAAVAAAGSITLVIALDAAFL